MNILVKNGEIIMNDSRFNDKIDEINYIKLAGKKTIIPKTESYETLDLDNYLLTSEVRAQLEKLGRPEYIKVYTGEELAKLTIAELSKIFDKKQELQTVFQNLVNRFLEVKDQTIGKGTVYLNFFNSGVSALGKVIQSLDNDGEWTHSGINFDKNFTTCIGLTGAGLTNDHPETYAIKYRLNYTCNIINMDIELYKKCIVNVMNRLLNWRVHSYSALSLIKFIPKLKGSHKFRTAINERNDILEERKKSIIEKFEQEEIMKTVCSVFVTKCLIDIDPVFVKQFDIQMVQGEDIFYISPSRLQEIDFTLKSKGLVCRRDVVGFEGVPRHNEIIKKFQTVPHIY